MDPQDKRARGKDLPEGAKPREGSQEEEIKRAERHPERHQGRQLIGAEDQ